MTAGIDQIMVCADASPSSEAALQCATELGAALDAKVKATFVFDISRISPIDPEIGLVVGDKDRDRLRLEARKHELGWIKDESVEIEVVDGQAVPALLDLSKRVDLVAVGRSGHGAVARFILGSVATHLVSHATTPILVVPPGEVGAKPLPMKGKSVVVAVDGSNPSIRAAAIGASIAKALGSRLELVSVVDLGQVDVYDGFFMTADRLAKVEERLHEKELKIAREAIKEEGIDITSTVIQGNAKGTLLDQTARDDVALVLVGKTGKGVFERMLQGSVSRVLATQGSCPVMIIS